MKKIISVLLCSVILLSSTVQFVIAKDITVDDTFIEGQEYDTQGDASTILGVEVVPAGFDWMDINVMVLESINSAVTLPVEGVKIEFIEEGLIFKDNTVRTVSTKNRSSQRVSSMTNAKGEFNKPMKMHQGYYTIVASKDGYVSIVSKNTKLAYHSTIKVNFKKENKNEGIIPPPTDGEDDDDDTTPPIVIPTPGPIPGGGGSSGTIQRPGNGGSGGIVIPDETGNKEVTIKPLPPITGGGRPGIIDDVDVPLSGWNKFWSNIFNGSTPLFSFQGECILHWFLLVLLLVLTVLATLDLLSEKKKIEEIKNLNENKKIN